MTVRVFEGVCSALRVTMPWLPWMMNTVASSRSGVTLSFPFVDTWRYWYGEFSVIKADLSFIRIPLSKFLSSTSDQWITWSSTSFEVFRTCSLGLESCVCTTRSPAVCSFGVVTSLSLIRTQETMGRREFFVRRLKGVAEICTTITFLGGSFLHHSLMKRLWAEDFLSLSRVIPQWHSSATMTNSVWGFSWTSRLSSSKCVSVSALRTYMNILFFPSRSRFRDSSSSFDSTPALGWQILFSVWSLSILYRAVYTTNSISLKTSLNLEMLW